MGGRQTKSNSTQTSPLFNGIMSQYETANTKLHHAHTKLMRDKKILTSFYDIRIVESHYTSQFVTSHGFPPSEPHFENFLLHDRLKNIQRIVLSLIARGSGCFNRQAFPAEIQPQLVADVTINTRDRPPFSFGKENTSTV